MMLLNKLRRIKPHSLFVVPFIAFSAASLVIGIDILFQGGPGDFIESYPFIYFSSLSITWLLALGFEMVAHKDIKATLGHLWKNFLVGFICLTIFVTFFSYPAFIILCGGKKPIVASNFAASWSYQVPDSRSYRVDFFTTDLFCSEEEAQKHGYRKSSW